MPVSGILFPFEGDDVLDHLGIKNTELVTIEANVQYFGILLYEFISREVFSYDRQNVQSILDFVHLPIGVILGFA